MALVAVRVTGRPEALATFTWKVTPKTALAGGLNVVIVWFAGTTVSRVALLVVPT